MTRPGQVPRRTAVHHAVPRPRLRAPAGPRQGSGSSRSGSTAGSLLVALGRRRARLQAGRRAHSRSRIWCSTTFLALFTYAIGLRVGPQFVNGLRSQGVQLVRCRARDHDRGLRDRLRRAADGSALAPGFRARHPLGRQHDQRGHGRRHGRGVHRRLCRPRGVHGRTGQGQHRRRLFAHLHPLDPWHRPAGPQPAGDVRHRSGGGRPSESERKFGARGPRPAGHQPARSTSACCPWTCACCSWPATR